MSQTIDQRVLEMKFDNDQFEKGIRTTIKSLEKLEEKLELKDAEKGFDKISNAATHIELSGIEDSLDSITNKFSLLGQIGMTALNRVANAVLDTGEKIVKMFTVDPISDGWTEYELKMGSVQTILSGVREQFGDEATAIDAVSAALDELNVYADKTIYSFSDMTSTIGKFTNQAVNLQDATDAVKGISNWAAVYGADKAQQQRAAYNMAQAFGVGYMGLVDWKSFENAMMAGAETRELFATLGVAAGKIGKNGEVQISQKQTANAFENFRDTLKAGWLTNDVLLEGMLIYSNAYEGLTAAELKAEMATKGLTVTEEQAEKFLEIGQNAQKAATQVKTFSQLMGTLKEAAGSGWSMTFDTFLGGFEGSKAFFTGINEILSPLIDGTSDFRNEWVEVFNSWGGNQAVMDGILESLQAFADVYNAIGEGIEAVLTPWGNLAQGQETWYYNSIFGLSAEDSWLLYDTGGAALNLANIVATLTENIQNFREWLWTPNEVMGMRTPLEAIRQVIQGIGSVIGVVWSVLYETGTFIANTFGAVANPILESLLGLFADVGHSIYDIYYNLVGQDTIPGFFENLYAVVEPVASLIGNTVGAVIDFVRAFLGLGDTDNREGVKTFSDAFKSIPLLIPAAAEGIADFAGKVKKGFAKLPETIRKKVEKPIDGLRETVTTFFTEGFGAEATQKVTTWFDETFVPTFGNVYNIVAGAFGSVVGFAKKIPTKLNNGWTKVQAGFKAIGDFKYNSNLSGLENFNLELESVLKAVFGDEKGEEISHWWNDEVSPHIQEIIDDWDNYVKPEFEKIRDGIKKFWSEDIPTVINEITGWFTSTGSEFKKSVKEFLFGVSGVDENGEEYTKEGAITRVLNWWQHTAIPWFGLTLLPWLNKTGTKVVDKVKAFLIGVAVEDENGESHYEGGAFRTIKKKWDEEIMPWFEDTLLPWLTTTGSKIWNSVGKFLFGYDKEIDYGDAGGAMPADPVEHVEGLFEKFERWATNIWNWIQGDGQKIFTGIKNFFDTYIKPIIDTFIELGGVIGGAFSNFFTMDVSNPEDLLGSFIERLGAFSSVGDWFGTKIGGLLGGIDLSGITNFLFGKNNEVEQVAQEVEKKNTNPFASIFDSIVNFLIPSASAEGTDESNVNKVEEAIKVLGDKTITTVGDLINALFDNKFIDLLKKIGTLVAISKAATIAKALTGGGHTFIGSIAEMFHAVADVISSLTWLLGVAAGLNVAESQLNKGVEDADKMVHMNLEETLDKAIGIIETLMWSVLAAAGVGAASDRFIDMGMDKLANKWLGKSLSDDETSGMVEYISALGQFFANISNALSSFLLLIPEYAALNLINAKGAIERMGDVMNLFTTAIDPTLRTLLGMTTIDTLGAMATSGIDDANTSSITKKMSAYGDFLVKLANALLFLGTAEGVVQLTDVKAETIAHFSELVKSFTDMAAAIGYAPGINSMLEMFAAATAQKLGVTLGGALSLKTIFLAIGGLLAALAVFGLAVIEEGDDIMAVIWTAGSRIRGFQQLMDGVSLPALQQSVEKFKTAMHVIDTIAKTKLDDVWKAEYTTSQLVTLTANFALAAQNLSGMMRNSASFEGPGKLIQKLKEASEIEFDANAFNSKAIEIKDATANLKIGSNELQGITTDAIEDAGRATEFATALQTLAAAVNMIPEVHLDGVTLGGAISSLVGQISTDQFTIADDGTLKELDKDKIRAFYTTLVRSMPDESVIAEIASYAQGGAGDLTLFTSGLESLGGTIKRYGAVLEEYDPKLFTDNADFLATVNTLGDNLRSDYSFTDNLSEVASGGDDSRLGKFGTDLEVLGGVVARYGEVLKKYQGAPWGANIAFLRNVNELGKNLGTKDRTGLMGFLDNLVGWKAHNVTLSDFAADMVSLGSGVESFGSALTGKYNEARFDQAVTHLTSIAKLGDFFGSDNFKWEWFGLIQQGEKKSDVLSNFGLMLNDMGNGLSLFYDNLTDTKGNAKDFSKFESALSFLEGFARVGSAVVNSSMIYDNIATLAAVLNNDGVITNMVDGLNMFVEKSTNLKTVPTNTRNAFGMLDTLVSLSGAVDKISGSSFTVNIDELQRLRDVLSSEANNTLGNALADIYDHYSGMVLSPTIAPVVDLTEADAAINGLTPYGMDFRNEFVQENINNIDLKDVQTVRLLSSDLSTITSAVHNSANTVANTVGTVSQSIRGMYVRIDSGALVGAIVAPMDAALGKRVGRVSTTFSTNVLEADTSSGVGR